MLEAFKGVGASHFHLCPRGVFDVYDLLLSMSGQKSYDTNGDILLCLSQFLFFAHTELGALYPDVPSSCLCKI